MRQPCTAIGMPPCKDVQCSLRTCSHIPGDPTQPHSARRPATVQLYADAHCLCNRHKAMPPKLCSPSTMLTEPMPFTRSHFSNSRFLDRFFLMLSEASSPGTLKLLSSSTRSMWTVGGCTAAASEDATLDTWCCCLSDPALPLCNQ